jgi:hypothetical protein
MTQKELERLVDRDLYQVFLLACPCRLPVPFAQHMWFVVNKKGELSRWEVLLEKNCCGVPSWGHLHKDALPVFASFGVIEMKGRAPWGATLVRCVEGDEDSAAHRLAQFIEKTPQIYPYLEKYNLTGPNSNTYIQWVLDNFPELGVKTPWNTFGTGYKAREVVGKK